MRLKNESGDTIIEVIFAITIFAFVAITSLMIMNQGIAAGERALEITLVRQQINAQAEALRFIHEARVVSPDSLHAETWDDLVTTYGRPTASSYGGAGVTACELPSSSHNPFILNARTARVGPAPTIETDVEKNPPYPQIVYKEDDPTVVEAAYGLWIESVPSSVLIARPFVDFHIRSCWYAPGSTLPMTIGTIVRLYDPR